MEVPFVSGLRHHSGLLKKVFRKLCSHQTSSVCEVKLEKLSESWWVVIDCCLCVPESLEEGIQLKDLSHQIDVDTWMDGFIYFDIVNDMWSGNYATVARNIILTIPDKKTYWLFLPKREKIPCSIFTKCILFFSDRNLKRVLLTSLSTGLSDSCQLMDEIVCWNSFSTSTFTTDHATLITPLEVKVS